MNKFIRESEKGFDRIDTEAGVIYGVKVLGPKSRNGRIYEDAAIRRAVPMYEGVTVNLNHQRIESGSRAVPDRQIQDRWGVLRNARYADGSVYADLHYLKNHPMTPQLIEAADRFPDTFGLSHDAAGDEQVIDGERRVIELFEIRSVDVVAEPATNNGLFECCDNVQEVRCPTGKGGGVDNSCKRKTKGGVKTIRPPVSQKIQAEAKAAVDEHMKKYFKTPKKFPPYEEGKDNGLSAWLGSKEGKAAAANKARMVSDALNRAKDHEKRSEYGSMDFERSQAKYFNARPITDYHTSSKKESVEVNSSCASLREIRSEMRRSRLALLEVKDGDGDGMINDGKPSQAPAPKKTPKVKSTKTKSPVGSGSKLTKGESETLSKIKSGEFTYYQPHLYSKANNKAIETLKSKGLITIKPAGLPDERVQRIDLVRTAQSSSDSKSKLTADDKIKRAERRADRYDKLANKFYDQGNDLISQSNQVWGAQSDKLYAKGNAMMRKGDPLTAKATMIRNAIKKVSAKQSKPAAQ